MKVFGISLVRNEADIIRVTLRHHLSQGLDRILILDNGSTDGTSEILREFSEKDQRVSWKRDDSPFDQAAITTELAREAQRQGADWILPFDADEFWWAENASLRTVLRYSEAGALVVPVVNFVQDRYQYYSTPEALLSMTRRVMNPAKPGPQTRALIEARKTGFVEMTYHPKWISSPTPRVKVYRGNHRATGIAGPPKECDEITLLHAPLRSKASLESRVDRRIRLEEAGINMDRGGWHIAYWTRTEREGMIDQEWAANSYEGDYLDVYGEKHEVTFDPRLRDLVAPHIACNLEGPYLIRGMIERAGRRMRGLRDFVKSGWLTKEISRGLDGIIRQSPFSKALKAIRLRRNRQ